MFDVATEPAVGAFLDPSLLRLSGLELLRTYLTGPDRWAPIAHLTGMHLTGVDVGRATCVMPLTEWLCEAPGAVSPAALIVPTDSALGSAIHTTLPPRTLYTTAELSMTWIRGVAPRGQVTATGECVHTSPTLALSSARVTDDDGNLVATATSRCTVFPPLPEVPPASDAPAAATARAPDPYERPVAGGVAPVDLGQPGKARLDARRRGEAPRSPFARLFGLSVDDVGDGTATVAAPCARWLCGPAGTVQGGVLAVVAHHAASAAAETTLEAGELTALDLKVNLLRPVPPSDASLSARGAITHRGRASALTAATVTHPDGRPAALLTASSMAQPGGR